MNKNPGVTLQNIRAAAQLIQPYVRRTPLEYSFLYGKAVEGGVFFKLENYQITGSFKARGAVNKILSLPDSAFKRGIITVSAGNHALGVGYALQIRNRTGLIILPGNASPAKVKSLQQFPVELEFHGENYFEAEKYTVELVSATEKVLISPYNDPDIIAGQGTAGLEILDDLPDCDIVLVPVGGGGLIAGAALALKALKSSITVYGIQPEASPVWKKSLEAGKLVEIPVEDTIADGLHGLVEPNSMTFPIIQKHVSDILLVSEKEIKAEMAEYIQYHHNLIEGSAAVVPAALKRYKSLFKNKIIAGILSGANIDVSLLKNILL